MDPVTKTANIADEFRKQAEEARQMARRCFKQEGEAMWLSLAENWLTLARQADEKTKENGFVASQTE